MTRWYAHYNAVHNKSCDTIFVTCAFYAITITVTIPLTNHNYNLILMKWTHLPCPFSLLACHYHLVKNSFSNPDTLGADENVLELWGVLISRGCPVNLCVIILQVSLHIVVLLLAWWPSTFFTDYYQASSQVLHNVIRIKVSHGHT